MTSDTKWNAHSDERHPRQAVCLKADQPITGVNLVLWEEHLQGIVNFIPLPQSSSRLGMPRLSGITPRPSTGTLFMAGAKRAHQ